jgi:predicted RNase H-like nuclease (RuvC/YqgF family)
MQIKYCTKCKIEKTIDQFYKGNDKDGLQYWCKNCQKEYQIKHKETINCRSKKYYQEHKEIKKYQQKRKERMKKYYQKHKNEIKKHTNIYRKLHKKETNFRSKTRRDKDINFKLGGNLRNRIHKILKGINKSKHTLDLIGCSVEFLKKHLASKFTKGMSWKNYGKWHVDHIRPCASFDLNKPEDQLKCFHYTNLQPLWATDNISKGRKI